MRQLWHYQKMFQKLFQTISQKQCFFRCMIKNVLDQSGLKSPVRPISEGAYSKYFIGLLREDVLFF